MVEGDEVTRKQKKEKKRVETNCQKGTEKEN